MSGRSCIRACVPCSKLLTYTGSVTVGNFGLNFMHYLQFPVFDELFLDTRSSDKLESSRATFLESLPSSIHSPAKLCG